MEIEISKEEDRVTVAGILVKNGYTVRMMKRLRTPKGKAVVYYLSVTDDRTPASMQQDD